MLTHSNWGKNEQSKKSSRIINLNQPNNNNNNNYVCEQSRARTLFISRSLAVEKKRTR